MWNLIIARAQCNHLIMLFTSPGRCPWKLNQNNFASNVNIFSGPRYYSCTELISRTKQIFSCQTKRWQFEQHIPIDFIFMLKQLVSWWVTMLKVWNSHFFDAPSSHENQINNVKWSLNVPGIVIRCRNLHFIIANLFLRPAKREEMQSLAFKLGFSSWRFWFHRRLIERKAKKFQTVRGKSSVDETENISHRNFRSFEDFPSVLSSATQSGKNCSR